MDIVVTITAMAALVTGIASLLMILEMKRQRMATSKPVLKILTKNRSATVDNESKTWSWDDNESSYFTILRLMNFGTGPALNVIVSWDVDLEVLVNVLKYFDPYKQMDFSYKNDFVNLDNSLHAIHNQRTVRIDAVPVNGVSDGEALKIPSYYVVAFEKYVELGLLKRPKADSKNSGAIELPDFPEIYVNFEYEEINGTKLKQKFRILLSCLFISPVEGEDKKEVHTTFNVEEISE